MGKKSTPAPPPAPDPTVVANAQSAANIASATAQQKLNMVNTHGPDGSVTYGADPNAPGGYSQTTTLSPGQQGIYDQGVSAQNQALGVANQQIGRVGDALGKTLDLNSLPAMAYGQGHVTQANPMQYGFDAGQQVQGHVGPTDFNQAAQEASDAVYKQATSRLDPQWGLNQQRQETQLANQGLSVDSDAYKSAMSQFNNAKTDAYNQANYSSIGAGQNEQNVLFNQALGQGQFANQAAAQMYGQNQGQAAFNNAATGQQFNQDMGNAQLANQQAGLQNQARNQALQEQAYVQNQPLNQFNSLMSSSQVQTPQGIQYTPSQVSPTDVTGAYALSQQAQQAQYQAQMQNQQSNMGGLFQLGAAALMAPMTGGTSLLGAGLSKISDVRAKTDIRRVGTMDNGLPVYSYRYRTGGPVEIGVMAQDVAQVRPDLVHEVGGLLAVNYGGF